MKSLRLFLSSKSLAFINYFSIKEFVVVIKGHILYQVNQLVSMSGYYFTNQGKFTDTCWIAELQIQKTVSYFVF